jgi:exopolyphosphatase/pppGpp-phosphohydrolase
MVGPASLWQVWRTDLPQGKQIETAALNRLKLWASFLDPDFKHSMHVARLSLQLYDGLPAKHRPADSQIQEQRSILQAAALLHGIGRAKSEKAHHKASYNLIRRLKPSLTWSAEKLRTVGVVARYHRGALPGAGQKTLTTLPPDQRKNALYLAAILRFANAFDAERDGRIQHLEVREQNHCLLIAAQGYSARHRLAESIAAARHVLETVCRCPVMVKPLKLRTENRQPRTGN